MLESGKKTRDRLQHHWLPAGLSQDLCKGATAQLPWGGILELGWDREPFSYQLAGLKERFSNEFGAF